VTTNFELATGTMLLRKFGDSLEFSWKTGTGSWQLKSSTLPQRPGLTPISSRFEVTGSTGRVVLPLGLAESRDAQVRVTSVSARGIESQETEVTLER
jgi:hypothetical protein